MGSPAGNGLGGIHWVGMPRTGRIADRDEDIMSIRTITHRSLLRGTAALAAVGLMGMGTATAAQAAPTGEATGTHASVANCTAKNLNTDVTQGDSSASHANYDISFTNTSGQPCKLVGYPGVSAVGHGDGTQLGHAATRSGDSGEATVIKPHGHAVTELEAVNVGHDGGPLGKDCKVRKGDGFRVYAPHTKAADYVPAKNLHACTGDVDWLSVNGVHPVS
jgi:hypothetical protein